MSLRRGEEEQAAGGENLVTVRVSGIEAGISTVTDITCTVTKIVIDDTTIPVSGGEIQLEPGKTMTIKVTYTAAAPGASGIPFPDVWYIGVTCKMPGQFGWDPTRHTGPGPTTNTTEIGNLKGPSSSETLVIKWYGIAGSYSEPPPG